MSSRTTNNLIRIALPKTAASKRKVINKNHMRQWSKQWQKNKRTLTTWTNCPDNLPVCRAGCCARHAGMRYTFNFTNSQNPIRSRSVSFGALVLRLVFAAICVGHCTYLIVKMKKISNGRRFFLLLFLSLNSRSWRRSTKGSGETNRFLGRNNW